MRLIFHSLTKLQSGILPRTLRQILFVLQVILRVDPGPSITLPWKQVQTSTHIAGIKIADPVAACHAIIGVGQGGNTLRGTSFIHVLE